MALLYACTLAIPGKNGLLAAMGCMVCTMGKHILVDGLIPPPPVMVMTAGVIVALLAAPGEWGKRVFVGYCLLNAFTFTTQPLMVLTDTFPEITAGSPAYDVGAFAIEVITLYMVMAAVSAATPDEALAVAFSTQVGLPVLAKHVLINKSGPPGPMIGRGAPPGPGSVSPAIGEASRALEGAAWLSPPSGRVMKAEPVIGLVSAVWIGPSDRS